MLNQNSACRAKLTCLGFNTVYVLVVLSRKQDRLSDDESADNLDEMDGGERESTLRRPEPMNEEQSDLPADENTTILPEDTRFVFVSAIDI